MTTQKQQTINHPLIATSGLHPWDSAVTHNLLRSLNPTYVRASINYNRWANEIAFYDRQYDLNKEYKIILTLDNIPLDKIAALVPEILNRYKVWGVTPVNEDEDATSAANRIKEFSRVAPEARLVGPDLQNDYSPSYMDELVRQGALACLDVLAMHDYFAVPGNGLAPPPPWDGLIYSHPDKIVNYYGFPNLKGRINWLKSYIPHTRKKFTDGPKVMITEYGTYINDLNDSILAAKISKDTDVPFVFCYPNGPAGTGTPSSYPYFHGMYSADLSSAVWSDPMLAYLNEIKVDLIINSEQRVELSLSATTKSGNKAKIINSAWSLSNNNVVDIKVASDGLSAEILAKELGGVQVGVLINSGSTNPIGSDIYIQVVNSDALTMEIISSDPTLK